MSADAEPQNWMTTGRTYGEARYSPLKEINAQDASSLGLVWSYDLDTQRTQESTPLEIDGVLYTTSAWSKVQAFDAANGKLLWQFDPQVPGAFGVKACCDVINRGVAYWEGRIYVGTIDGRLIAVDAKSGRQVWSVQTTDRDKDYTISGAPRIVKGRVIIGNGGAEFGVRGYVSAYDAQTGKMDWRFYIVPGQPGVRDGAASDTPLKDVAEKTWSGQWWNQSGGGGGGTAWDSMAYDPDLDLLYIGTGNSAYWNKKYRSPGQGDNLFVSSILALRPETGQYVWHFQEVPGDEWDYTATQHMILADLPIDGHLRKVLMQAPKNGVFYVLDRQTGHLISAKPYIPINWARSIDQVTGRPDIAPEARYDQTGAMWRAKPSGYGGHNWQPMAFNKDTGLVYFAAFQLASTFVSDPNFKPLPVGMNLGVDVTAAMKNNRKLFMQDLPKGYLLAWNPVTQQEVWRAPSPTYWNGGALTTAGNIVVQGDGGGHLNVYNASTGQKIWAFDAQTGIVAAPITFSVAGKQYISIVVGAPGGTAISNAPGAPGGVKGGQMATVAPPPKGRVLTFALRGSQHLPASEPYQAYIPVAPAQFASDDTIAAGQRLFETTCMACHGLDAVSDGNFPDLRHSAAIGDKAAFGSIVVDGALAANGMVSFKRNYSPQQVEAIRAYLIAQARGEQHLK